VGISAPARGSGSRSPPPTLQVSPDRWTPNTHDRHYDSRHYYCHLSQRTKNRASRHRARLGAGRIYGSDTGRVRVLGLGAISTTVVHIAVTENLHSSPEGRSSSSDGRFISTTDITDPLISVFVVFGKCYLSVSSLPAPSHGQFRGLDGIVVVIREDFNHFTMVAFRVLIVYKAGFV